MSLLKCQEYISPIHIGGKSYEKHFGLSTTCNDLIEACERMAKNKGQKVFEVKSNQKIVVEKCFDDEKSRVNWCGGNCEEIFLPKKDFTQFNKFQDRLRALGVWNKLKTNFAQKNVRRRVRDAYDGEFDFDKRFDLTPFTRRGLLPNAHKAIKLNISFSFHFGIGSSTITEFGAFAAAIANILENHGIGVELNIFNMLNGLFEYYSSDLHVTWAKVKRYDEYLPPQMILQVFNSNFYRRAIFFALMTQADLFGKECQENLGSPASAKDALEFKGNEIYIHSTSVLQNQEQTLSKIMDFIEKMSSAA